MVRANRTTEKRNSATIFRIIFVLSAILAFEPRHVAAQEDVTSPTLLDFSFSPNIIDTTNSSQAVTVTGEASDDISGVANAAGNVCFLSPTAAQEVCGNLQTISRSGSPEVATFEGVITFPQFSESGTWSVRAVQLKDNTNNVGQWNTPDLQAGGFPTELQVVSGQEEPDSDNDGVPDNEDDCPNSDLSPTVVIDDCDSGVANELFLDNVEFGNGCTISDLITMCAENAGNHDQFVSCVSSLTNDLHKAGIITGRQKGAVQRCAAQAAIP
jgi:hypothetical protein